MDNKNREEITASYDEIIKFSIIIFIVIIIFFCIPFFILWLSKYKQFVASLTAISFLRYLGKYSLIGIIIFISGIIIHELLHLLPMVIYLKKFNVFTTGIALGGKAIYVHCKEPVSLRLYRFSIILPSIILGFIPIIISFLFINMKLFLFGIFFLLSGSGDLLIFKKLRNISTKAMILDHPEKVGCYIIYDKK